ncbi:MAG: hypothetical protein HC817_03970 [Saprospiraceae bacterium]|nr:hypothetical protein [Saprospiraceae bacterium]
MQKPIFGYLIAFFSFFISIHLSAQTFEADLSRAYRLLSIAQERDRQATIFHDELKTRRIRIEEDLIDAKENPQSLSKKEKEALEKMLKNVKTQEKFAGIKRKQTAEFLTEVVAIVKAPDKKRAKFLTDYEKKNGKILSEVTDNQSVAELPLPEPNKMPTAIPSTELSALPIPIQNTTPSVSEGKKQNEKTKKQPKTEKPTKIESSNTLRIPVKYDPSKDVSLNPPAPDCLVEFDGVDNFTGRRKREMATQLLFAHTEEFMRPTMGNKDYITCDMTVARVQGGFYFMNLHFKILTKEAQRTFGFLDKGSPISFKLIDGNTINLINTKTDIGVVDPVSNTTSYKANFQISASDVKALIKTELDIVRVAWSAGYEDYEIYDMSVVSNSLRCLEKEMK